MLEHALLFYVLKHPLAALVVFVATADAEETTVVRHYRPAELGDVRLEID